jgi:peptidoglycan/LPS O-acetylase OafA/YrhL
VYNLGLGAGVLAARLLDHSMKRPAIMLALGSIAFILFMAVERLNEDASSNINGGLGTVLYTISAFLIVLSLAQLEAKLLFRRAWLIELLGGASYVFYLFHGLISSLFIRIIHLLAPNLFGWFVTIIAMVVTIFFVILIHVFVEIPLLRALAPRSPSVQRSTQELETWKP